MTPRRTKVLRSLECPTHQKARAATLEPSHQLAISLGHNTKCRCIVQLGVADQGERPGSEWRPGIRYPALPGQGP